MGLATNAAPSQLVISVDAETTLRDLAIRSDIIKTMHKALATDGVDRPIADYTIHGGDTPPIIGRLVAKGLYDELTGEAYTVIDAVDGRAHHVHFRDAEPPPIGGIVEVRRTDVDAHRGLALGSPYQSSGISMPIVLFLEVVDFSGSTERTRRLFRHLHQRYLKPTRCPTIRATSRRSDTTARTTPTSYVRLPSVTGETQ